MRKLRHFVAISLDGYIATPTGGINWLFHDQDYGYADFISQIDTVIMGRKTYDVSISFGDDVYPGLAKFVFARSRPVNANPNYDFVIGPAPAEFTRELLKKDGKDIWLVGGGEITRELLAARLIDSITVSIHPILLGGGTPLFPAGFDRTQLKLARTVPFNTGLVQLYYEIPRA